MIQIILLYILQAVFFILSLVLYVFLTACFLPHNLLAFRFDATKIKDRGIKRYLFQNGRAIVYLPERHIRPYIPQYILSDNNGERFLKCMLHPSIRSVHYRVFPFDANDQPLQVLDVEDPARTPGLSLSVPLPLNTAYVSISLLEVNDKTFHSDVLRYSPVKMLVYLVTTIVLTVLEGHLFQQCLLFLADLLFAYSDVVTLGYGFCLFAAVIIGALYALIVLYTHFIKGSRIQK